MRLNKLIINYYIVQTIQDFSLISYVKITNKLAKHKATIREKQTGAKQVLEPKLTTKNK